MFEQPAYAGLSGKTNTVTKQMVVPLIDTPQAANVRAHELCHAAISPTELPSLVAKDAGVSIEAYSAAEDMRCNAVLTQATVDLSAGFSTVGEIQEFARAVSTMVEKERMGDAVRMTALAMVSCADSNDDIINFQKHVRGDVFNHALPVVKGASKMMKRKFYGNGMIPHIRTIQVAKYLDEMLKPSPMLIPVWGEQQPVELVPAQGWGHMEIHKPPLLENAKLKRAMSIQRNSDSGIKIRRLDRLLSDQKVFTIKKKIPGGTVVIDGSGSMALSPEQVFKIVVNAPQATVAIYSGGLRRNNLGMLRILCRDGKMVKKEWIHSNPDGGGNLVDGPALAWLGKQEEPRIWVSDGGVHGVGGLSFDAVKDADRLVKAGDIIQLPDTDAAIAYFKQLATPKKQRLLVDQARARGVKF